MRTTRIHKPPADQLLALLREIVRSLPGANNVHCYIGADEEGVYYNFRLTDENEDAYFTSAYATRVFGRVLGTRWHKELNRPGETPVNRSCGIILDEKEIEPIYNAMIAESLLALSAPPDHRPTHVIAEDLI